MTTRAGVDEPAISMDSDGRSTSLGPRVILTLFYVSVLVMVLAWILAFTNVAR
ncbi:hypothetical protein [Nocardia sp. NPDC050413]|uniref:hypothetical protein n=1 Tax=Nocardia sp. NPDC050413 TaxID=3155784 RepID=UPI0033C32BE9